jgi:hypothetical protein
MRVEGRRGLGWVDRPAGSRELARASVGGCQGWGVKRRRLPSDHRPGSLGAGASDFV